MGACAWGSSPLSPSSVSRRDLDQTQAAGSKDEKLKRGQKKSRNGEQRRYVGPKGRWGISESNSWEEMLQYQERNPPPRAAFLKVLLHLTKRCEIWDDFLLKK